MARSMSSLGKPMLSMLAMAASRSLPIASAEGSLKREPSVDWVGAGEGVAGAFCVVLADCAGAAGAAGVWGTWTGAGVAGAAAGLLEDVAGAAFGCAVSLASQSRWHGFRARTFCVMHTTKPFSSMLYDPTVFASWRILPVRLIRLCERAATRGAEHTRIDELKRRAFKVALFLDLFLEAGNLSGVSIGVELCVAAKVQFPMGRLRPGTCSA